MRHCSRDTHTPTQIFNSNKLTKMFYSILAMALLNTSNLCSRCAPESSLLENDDRSLIRERLVLKIIWPLCIAMLKPREPNILLDLPAGRLLDSRRAVAPSLTTRSTPCTRSRSRYLKCTACSGHLPTVVFSFSLSFSYLARSLNINIFMLRMQYLYLSACRSRHRGLLRFSLKITHANLAKFCRWKIYI